jgi:nitrogen regulatory protein P-II 1
MKAIHAYVRHHLGERIVADLVNAGCRTMSVLEVRGVTHDVAAGALEFSVDLAQRVERVLKIEIVCDHDTDADRWVDVLVRAAYTGQRGDGLVSVLPVDRAVHISTARAAEPREAL